MSIENYKKRIKLNIRGEFRRIKFNIANSEFVFKSPKNRALLLY